MVVAQKTGKVTIRGSGIDTRLLIDGELVQNCTGFTLKGPGPDQPTTLILEIDVQEMDVEGEFDVEVNNG